MNYKYEPDRPLKKDDVVLWENPLVLDIEEMRPYLVLDIHQGLITGEIQAKVIDSTGCARFIGTVGRRIIKTKPGTEAKTGDTVVSLTNALGSRKIGDIFNDIEIGARGHLRYKIGNSSSHWNEFLVLETKLPFKVRKVKVNHD